VGNASSPGVSHRRTCGGLCVDVQELVIKPDSGNVRSNLNVTLIEIHCTIPVEKHIVWSKSESAQALLSAAEQADIELLVAGAFQGPALNRRRFLSSAARKMVDSARCSLLLLVQPEVPGAGRREYRRCDNGLCGM
jgi:hypothetical protein